MEFVLRIILLFFIGTMGVIIATFAWWSFQEYWERKKWADKYSCIIEKRYGR